MCRLPSHLYRFLPTLTAGYMPCDLRERVRDLKEMPAIAGFLLPSVVTAGMLVP